MWILSTFLPNRICMKAFERKFYLLVCLLCKRLQHAAKQDTDNYTTVWARFHVKVRSENQIPIKTDTLTAIWLIIFHIVLISLEFGFLCHWRHGVRWAIDCIHFTRAALPANHTSPEHSRYQDRGEKTYSRSGQAPDLKCTYIYCYTKNSSQYSCKSNFYCVWTSL